MKAKPNKVLWSLPLAACTIAFTAAVAQQENPTVWNADFEVPGNWEDGTWSDGAPVADNLAGILKGGTVNFPAMGRENRMPTSKWNKK